MRSPVNFALEILLKHPALQRQRPSHPTYWQSTSHQVVLGQNFFILGREIQLFNFPSVTMLPVPVCGGGVVGCDWRSVGEEG